MRKVIQITAGMYTRFEEEKDFDDQKYAIIALCDDGSIWQYTEEHGWENVLPEGADLEGM